VGRSSGSFFGLSVSVKFSRVIGVDESRYWDALRRKDTAAAGSYTFVITVTSFFLWYRPIYLGYKKEGGLALFFCESRSD
jgi:hypothetical protein